MQNFKIATIYDRQPDDSFHTFVMDITNFVKFWAEIWVNQQAGWVISGVGPKKLRVEP